MWIFFHEAYVTIPNETCIYVIIAFQNKHEHTKLYNMHCNLYIMTRVLYMCVTTDHNDKKMCYMILNWQSALQFGVKEIICLQKMCHNSTKRSVLYMYVFKSQIVSSVHNQY